MKVDISTKKYPNTYMLIDKEDYEKIKHVSISPIKSKKRRNKYAVAYFRKSKRKYVHRVIMNDPPGMQIDHINGNSLDNRKCNLRICTNSQNNLNKPKQPTYAGNKPLSKYKGVTSRKLANGKKVYDAFYSLNRKKIHIGCFTCEKKAALAFNNAAKKHYGEFAWLNKL